MEGFSQRGDPNSYLLKTAKEKKRKIVKGKL